jgi:serine/threonine-protein kinase SRPK3
MRMQYHWIIDGGEPINVYEVGEYHPIMLNDVLNSRYTMLDKLGHGRYSTIWLARDVTMIKTLVAQKVGISHKASPI